MRTASETGRITPLLVAGVVGTLFGLAPAAALGAEPPADEVAQPGEGGEQLEIDLGAIQAMMGGARPAPKKKQDFKPWKEVSEGFTKVNPSGDAGSYYGIWVNEKEQQMLAELPRGYERQKQFFAMTVAGGEIPKDRVYDGFDISPALFGEGPSPRREMFYYWGEELWGARVGDFKLHFTTKTEYVGQQPERHDPPLLYHLGHDPGERHNVAGQHPGVIERIRAAVKRHEESVERVPSLLTARVTDE